jgi:hypothetical protein
MIKKKNKASPKARYSRLARLIGIMKEYNITVAEMAKYIGRATCTVSKANNGHNLYDSMDMLNIQKLINLKSKKHYTIDEIFYS